MERPSGVRREEGKGNRGRYPVRALSRRIRDRHLLRSDVKARHDRMVDLVTRMMELKKQQARAPKKQSPSARQLLDQKLAITDEQVADG